MHLSRRHLIQCFENLFDQRAIKLTFKDGFHGIFPYVWLRDCSLDEKTYTISSSMKGRLHYMRDFDVNVEPIGIGLDEQANCLLVEWPGEVKSRYEKCWLQARCPGNSQVRQRRRAVYLGRESVRVWGNRVDIENRMKRFSHQSFLENDKILHDFLGAVCMDGIAVLEGASRGNGEDVLEAIVQRIGMLQPTHFGETFEVYPKSNASNMAYSSSQELPYHTDFPSLQHPPQLQMLHMCRRAECGGGKSMFVDGFHIGEQMARKHNDAFKLLCKLPLEFIEEGFDIHGARRNGRKTEGEEENIVERVDFSMVARHKTFKINERDQIFQVQFGNVMRSWFIDFAADALLVQQLYDALKLFTELCYLPENQLIFPLDSGDTVLWANTRLLHARSAYKLIGVPERERLVVGCYFGWDTIKSRIRFLRERLALPEHQQTL